MPGQTMGRTPAPAPAPAEAPRLPAAIPDPPEAYRVYLVDPVAGSLTPLEMKIGKQYTWSGHIYAYIKETQSAVVIPMGTRLVFAFRAEAKQKDAARWEDHPVGSAYQLEMLMVHHPGVGRPPSDDGRRYGTGQFIPIHQEAYGGRKVGLNAKKPELVSQTFLFWPTAPVPPGEYAFSIPGLLSYIYSAVDAHAFAMTAADTAVDSPSPSVANIAPTAPVAAPIGGMALVTIESSPSNAEVTVDGEFIGSTPLTGYRLNAGIRRVVVTKKGYGRWTRELKVSPGVNTRLLAELEGMTSGD
jgi:hypothetical protein